MEHTTNKIKPAPPMENRIHSYTIKWNTTHRITAHYKWREYSTPQIKGKKLRANKKPRHAANEREVIYACAFMREGLTPSSMLKFARFFLGVTFRWHLIMFETKFVQQSLRRCPECLVPLSLGSANRAWGQWRHKSIYKFGEPAALWTYSIIRRILWTVRRGSSEWF